MVILGDLDEYGLERLPEFSLLPPVLEQCHACGDPIPSQFVSDTTRGMLDRLDARRRAWLAVTYQGALPTVLCASCCNLTVGVMNQAATV